MQIFIITGLWVCVAQDAWAYLDPGTGSIVLQGVIAALATLCVYVSLGWKHIRGWILRIKGRSKRRGPQ